MNGSARRWKIAGGSVAVDRPVVAGVLNVTPDSFSDGGRFLDPSHAVQHAFEMVEDGAGIIDVGAESTRPGASDVSVADEWRRLEPVFSGLSDLPVPISVDTTKPEVARRAIDAGATIINDVSGGRRSDLLAVAAETGAGLVLMHMRGNPRTMQEDTVYEDIVRDVRDALVAARDAAIAAGCEPETIALDPGLGFGKSVGGNLELIARLGELTEVGSPLWFGPSRKSFLGALLDRPEDDRLEGTIAACVIALANGARVFRVHDVAAVARALAVAWAIESHGDRAAPAGGSRDARG